MNEQFNNLNRNLGRLAEHMDKQFVTVRQDIYEMRTDLKIAIYESTKALADLMGQHFTALGANLRAEFSGIRTEIQRLQQGIAEVHYKVIDVGQQINTYGVASLANQYIDLKSQALTTFFALDYRGQGRQEYNDAITHADNLANWASGLGGAYSKRPELTLGSGVRNDADAVIAEVSSSLHGISYRIDKIRQCVIQINPAIYGMLNTSLANPIVWADTARSYMTFIHKYLRIAIAGCAKQFCEVQTRNLDLIGNSLNIL